MCLCNWLRHPVIKKKKKGIEENENGDIQIEHSNAETCKPCVGRVKLNDDLNYEIKNPNYQ